MAALRRAPGAAGGGTVAGLEGAGGSLTVPKPGKPQFDYDKEVKAAKEAYPQLRKKLRLPDTIKLPGE